MCFLKRDIMGHERPCHDNGRPARFKRTVEVLGREGTGGWIETHDHEVCEGEVKG